MTHLVQADIVFPVSSIPVQNGILRLDDQGVILEVIDPENGHAPDPVTIRKVEGFLCPGFINSHCHLELSYLRGLIPEKAGMTGFIAGLLKARHSVAAEKIKEAVMDAEHEMLKNGIVATGDISNGSDSFFQKSQNNMHYHTFIELFDLGEEKAAETFRHGEHLRDVLMRDMPEGHSCSIVPHAPYTVSKKLMSLLNLCAYENNYLVTMHSQESAGENEIFISKTGPLYDLFTGMGIDMSYIPKTGFNSLRSTLIHLSNCQKIMLVHNTYASAADVEWAEKYAKMIYWCLCPNANLYIEDRLPEIRNFMKHRERITLGTDSLASNHGLSILEEMKTISRSNPDLTFSDILPWATINGARFFGIDKIFGSFEKGKRPGINLLENTDPVRQNITQATTVRKLF